MKYVSFNEYVKEILKTAEYRKDTDIGCVVAIASVLPGCMTQGDNFEEAHDNLKTQLNFGLPSGCVRG